MSDSRARVYCENPDCGAYVQLASTFEPAATWREAVVANWNRRTREIPAPADPFGALKTMEAERESGKVYIIEQAAEIARLKAELDDLRNQSEDDAAEDFMRATTANLRAARHE